MCAPSVLDGKLNGSSQMEHWEDQTLPPTLGRVQSGFYLKGTELRVPPLQDLWVVHAPVHVARLRCRADVGLCAWYSLVPTGRVLYYRLHRTQTHIFKWIWRRIKAELLSDLKCANIKGAEHDLGGPCFLFKKTNNIISSQSSKKWDLSWSHFIYVLHRKPTTQQQHCKIHTIWHL